MHEARRKLGPHFKKGEIGIAHLRRRDLRHGREHFFLAQSFFAKPMILLNALLHFVEVRDPITVEP